MAAATALIALVLALDGESSTASNSTGVAVIAAVSMVSGYVLLAALWWFVFRDRSRGKGKRDSAPPR